MCYTGLFKRIVPFVLTFAAGLFIASFFVSIALPEGNWRSRRGIKKFQEIQRLQADNELLRDKNLRLQMENDELRRNAQDWGPVGETPLAPDFELNHHPPTPPKRPKQPKFE